MKYVTVQIIASLQLLLLLHVGVMILGASSMQVSLAGAAASSKLTLEDIAKSDKLITDSGRIGDIDHDNSADHNQQQHHHDVRKLGNLGHGKQLVKTKALLQETAQETIQQPATSPGSSPETIPCVQPQGSCHLHDEIICYIRFSTIVFARPGCSCAPLHQCSLPLYDCWLYLHNQYDYPIYCGF
ncbi:unnamed protein product [Sphagnum jensenii]|uniref:Uncharacterized protein n=1 Tax=Sphagnum jensenii TaxID=128206 RepID=A0ABP0V525_9BRYO